MRCYLKLCEKSTNAEQIKNWLHFNNNVPLLLSCFCLSLFAFLFVYFMSWNKSCFSMVLLVLWHTGLRFNSCSDVQHSEYFGCNSLDITWFVALFVASLAAACESSKTEASVKPAAWHWSQFIPISLHGAHYNIIASITIAILDPDQLIDQPWASTMSANVA